MPGGSYLYFTQSLISFCHRFNENVHKNPMQTIIFITNLWVTIASTYGFLHGWVWETRTGLCVCKSSFRYIVMAVVRRRVQPVGQGLCIMCYTVIYLQKRIKTTFDVSVCCILTLNRIGSRLLSNLSPCWVILTRMLIFAWKESTLASPGFGQHLTNKWNNLLDVHILSKKYI